MKAIYKIQINILVALLLVSGFNLQAQSIDHTGHQHLIEYTFQITEGLTVPDDATRLDQILESLADLVAESRTDFTTRFIKVRVYDLRIPYESLVFAIEQHGFRAGPLLNTQEIHNH
jgi:hypothetical protein